MEQLTNLNQLAQITKRFIVFEGRQYQRVLALPNHKLYYCEIERHYLEYKADSNRNKSIVAYYSVYSPEQEKTNEKNYQHN